MPIERLVALHVTDDELYNKYRHHMSPILQTYGGEFGYDFKISEVLKSQIKEPINRVFTLFFASEADMDRFFCDENYLKIRNKFFDPAVSASTVIAKYQR